MKLAAPLNIPTRLKEIDELLAANNVTEARAKLRDLSTVFRTFFDLLCAVTHEPVEKP